MSTNLPPAQDGYAVVNADGTVARGAKGYSVTHAAGSGQYEVDTVSDVKTCTYSVTAGSADVLAPAPAIATAARKRENRSAIMVATYDGRGNHTDSGFHLIVRCSDTSGNEGAAAVNADGTLAHAVGASTVGQAGTGSYFVTFNHSDAASVCAFTGAIGLGGAVGTSDPGFLTVGGDGGSSAAVRTYDRKGNPADLGFHIFMSCPP